MERMYRFLNALGKDVEIVVRPRRDPGVHVRMQTRAVPARGAKGRVRVG
jgi:hypothetical protein